MLHGINDVLASKTIATAAEAAKNLELKPLIINDRKSFYYTSKNLIFEDSNLALPLGDKLIEMRAITKAGINQMRNILKLYAIETVHFKGKNSEHLLFKSDKKYDVVPYDQLRLRCLNQQHGIFINFRHAYTIIPPSAGLKSVTNYDAADLPSDLFNDLFNLHMSDVMKGSFNG